MKKIIFVILFTIACFQLSETKAQTLSIEITGIEKVNNDTIFIAIYDNPKSFLKSPKFSYKVPVNKSKIVQKVKIPIGTYAITLYLDSNRNGICDRGLFGIPKERWGLSNNVKNFMGPPSFKKSKFDFNKDMTINIKLR